MIALKKGIGGADRVRSLALHQEFDGPRFFHVQVFVLYPALRVGICRNARVWETVSQDAVWPLRDHVCGPSAIDSRQFVLNDNGEDNDMTTRALYCALTVRTGSLEPQSVSEVDDGLRSRIQASFS